MNLLSVPAGQEITVDLPCLTFWQPWGTACADKVKTIETRYWPWRITGPTWMGIHAGKKLDDFGTDLIPLESRQRAASERGVLIAVAQVVKVKRYSSQDQWEGDSGRGQDKGGHRCPPEFFEPGKWGFVLENIRRVRPVPLRGFQKFWNFQGAIEFVEEGSQGDLGPLFT